MKALFYDTETTGLPVWNEPSDGENQPHIVQLAAQLVDLETREPLESICLFVSPDGWEWDDDNEAFKVHGITAEHAKEFGISEVLAVQMFFALWEKGGEDVIRIGFSEVFDRRLIRIATKRYPALEQYMEPWKELPKDRSYCCMNQAKKAFGLKKNPKLVDIYHQITGNEIEGAHDARVDVNATIEVYWAIQDN